MGGSQERMGLAMRCIVAAMVIPGTPFNVEAIAQATGLQEHQVSYALSSEECQKLLEKNCMDACRLAMNRTLRVYMDILTDPETSKETKLSAGRAVTTMYRTLVMSLPKVDSKTGEEEVMKILKTLDAPRTHDPRVLDDEDGGQ